MAFRIERPSVFPWLARQCKDFFYRLRQLDGREILHRIQIDLVRFIYHADQPMFLRTGVLHYLIDLAQLQRGGICLILDADDESRFQLGLPTAMVSMLVISPMIPTSVSDFR
jgi:hypothetical protein